MLPVHSFPSSPDKESRFLFYLEAATLVQALGIQSFEEYRLVYRHYPGLPSTPNKQYATEWPGWPSFLGRSTRTFRYASYAQAQAQAQAQGWTTARQYQSGYRRHPGLPQAPAQVYGEAWQSWGAFLHQALPVPFLPYSEAVALVQRLQIRTSTAYGSRYKDHPGLPYSPSQTYADQWPGWTAFLRNGQGFFTYEEAKAYVGEWKIRRRDHYLRVAHQELRLPRSPERRYQEDWPGWPTFLGRPTLKRAQELVLAASDGVHTD